MQATCTLQQRGNTRARCILDLCVVPLGPLLVGPHHDERVIVAVLQNGIPSKLARQFHVQLRALALRPHGLRMLGGLGPASTAPHSYSRTRDLRNLSNAGCKRSSANAPATEHAEQHTTSRETMSVTFKRDHAKRVTTSKELSAEGDS
jgi:hypothetical protein